MKNGHKFYEGQVAYGLKEGQGVMRSPNGDRYKGEYHLNAKHGKGIYVWANGNIYSGSFIRDMPS